MAKYWWAYLLELVVGIVILFFSVNAFLLYAYISIMIMIDRRVNYFRKLIRVFQISNEAKLLALTRKMSISQKELNETVNEGTAGLTEKQKEELENDIASLIDNG